MEKSVNDKILMAINIILDIQSANEIISVIDNGCIINYKREISEWFLAILEGIKVVEKLTFSIVSSNRINKHEFRSNHRIYNIDVPELESLERNGLLSRYAEHEGLDLSREDLQFFSKFLSGYPGQVFYAVELIKDSGIKYAKDNANLIREFSSTKAQILLRKYEENDRIRILHLLSEFDFISYEFIFEIIEENEENFEIINELEASSLCERLGANGEYLRINDTVRDYLRRSKFSLPEEYEIKLKKHVDNFLETYPLEEKDLSDYFYSLKKALIDKKNIDFRYLIPSHFLKTMKELYDRHRRYDDVIVLADRVLSNQYSLDDAIKKEIRSLLCLSLARSRKRESKDRFLEEVQKINGPEHDFYLDFIAVYKVGLKKLKIDLKKL